MCQTTPPSGGLSRQGSPTTHGSVVNDSLLLSFQENMKGTKMDGSIKRRLLRIYGTGMDWQTKIHHKKVDNVKNYVTYVIENPHYWQSSWAPKSLPRYPIKVVPKTLEQWKQTWLIAAYRGLYCPVIWGSLLNNHNSMDSIRGFDFWWLLGRLFEGEMENYIECLDVSWQDIQVKIDVKMREL